MFSSFKNLITDQRAQTLVEYGLILALIALVVVVVATTLGGRVSNVFNNASTDV